MGKQIHFVYTEDDLQKLLRFLENNHGRFVVNSILYSPMQMAEQVIFEMESSRHTQYAVVFESDDALRIDAKHREVVDGTAIEMINCRKWEEDKRLHYDIGRFYVSMKKDGTYDAHTLTLYNKICSYVKKNFRYKKELYAYLSIALCEPIENGEIHLSQFGHPLIWRSSN